MFHKVLKKAFVVDLKSAHGTFIGYRRLEPHVPIQLPADVQLRIGASTRRYVFKNKPLETEKRQQEIELPEEEEDLDNLTEYNTARNKKIVQMVRQASMHNFLIEFLARWRPGGTKTKKQKTKIGNME